MLALDPNIKEIAMLSVQVAELKQRLRRSQSEHGKALIKIGVLEGHIRILREGKHR